MASVRPEPGASKITSDPRWLGAIACLAMGVVVCAINLLITTSAVASRPAFTLDAVASAAFLVVLLILRGRVPEAFYLIVTTVCTGLITATIALNPRHTGNEAYYLLVVLYASYFYTRRQAAFQVGLIVLAYGVVTFTGVHDGSAGPRWLNLSGVIIVVSGVVFMLRSRLEELIATLSIAALTDPLTGLLNRRAFETRIHEEVARSARQGAPLSLLALDIDHFKRVNDRFGHPIGDAALVSIAETVREASREADVVARVGGEEFSVLLVDADLEAARLVAERIRAAVEAETDKDYGRLTVSVGVAAVQPAVENPVVVVQRDADRVLYAAKESGRNRVVCADALAARPEDLRPRELAPRRNAGRRPASAVG